MSTHDLLVDLDKLIDILWYSFSSQQPAAMVTPSPPPDKNKESTYNTDIHDQTYFYILSIANILADFVEGLQPKKSPEIASAIKMFHKLDNILIRLLNEPFNLILSEPEQLDNLINVVQRSRLAVRKTLDGVPDHGFDINSIYHQVSRLIS